MKNRLLNKARKIINHANIMGSSLEYLKLIINDNEELAEALLDIAQQANDVFSYNQTVKTFSKELVDLAIKFALINDNHSVISFKPNEYIRKTIKEYLLNKIMAKEFKLNSLAIKKLIDQ